MANFTQELGYWGEGPQTIGTRSYCQAALLQHPSRGTFSNYDEKVLGEATLYGLPMLRINLPVTTTNKPGGLPELPGVTAPAAADLTTDTKHITFTYATSSTNSGTFFQVANVDDLQVSVGRPVQPRTSEDVHQQDSIAHGVLHVGGTFQDFVLLNPVVSQIVTDQTPLHNEPLYDTSGWYPTVAGSLNRFLSIDGQSHERLIIVPGQYRANGPRLKHRHRAPVQQSRLRRLSRAFLGH